MSEQENKPIKFSATWEDEQNGETRVELNVTGYTGNFPWALRQVVRAAQQRLGKNADVEETEKRPVGRPAGSGAGAKNGGVKMNVEPERKAYIT